MAAVWGRSLLRSVANQTHLRTQVLGISSETPTALVKRKEAVPQNERKPEEIEPLNATTGLPDAQVNRLARIYMPTRNAMQSGTNNTHNWRLTFDNKDRWENPLMGWTSSGDPLSNVTMSFRTAEEAIDFAVRKGFTYQVSKPHTTKMRSKSYADSFSWNKRTRVGSK